MQSLLQLNPPIPLNTPKGEGLAVLVIDYGPDFDLWWTVVISKGEFAGQIWTYSNAEVRGVPNITLGRHPAAAPAMRQHPGSEPGPATPPADRATSHDGAERHRPGANGNGHGAKREGTRLDREN